MIISEKQIMQLISMVQWLSSMQGIDHDIRLTSARLIDDIKRQQSEELKEII